MFINIYKRIYGEGELKIEKLFSEISLTKEKAIYDIFYRTSNSSERVYEAYINTVYIKSDNDLILLNLEEDAKKLNTK